jgi:hypothetical protein
MATIIETEDPSGAGSLAASGSLERDMAVVSSLQRLQRESAFRNYCALLRKRLEEQKEKLTREADDREIARIQGFVAGLRYALDTQAMLNHYKNRVENNKPS